VEQRISKEKVKCNKFTQKNKMRSKKSAGTITIIPALF